jgi:hypothetical protein
MMVRAGHLIRAHSRKQIQLPSTILAATSRRALSVMSVSPLEVLTFNPTTKHTATVIFLHVGVDLVAPITHIY